MVKVRRKVIKRIRKFYEREKRGVQFKINRGILTQDIGLVQIVIKDAMKTMVKNPSWVRNTFVEMGESGHDFMNNTKTIHITYLYPKYGNM